MRHSLWFLAAALVACSGSTAGVDIDGGASDGGGSDAAGQKDAGGDGAADGGSVVCADGSVTFTMIANGGYCLGHLGDCSNEWLTILDPTGQALTLGNLCGTDCSTCEAKACPGLCAAPSPVPAGGAKSTWTGTFYAASTCGGGGGIRSVSCLQAQCAAPGHYTAHMCAYAREGDAGLACSASNVPTCTDVAFDWPLTGNVSGTVGP